MQNSFVVGCSHLWAKSEIFHMVVFSCNSLLFSTTFISTSFVGRNTTLHETVSTNPKVFGYVYVHFVRHQYVYIHFLKSRNDGIMRFKLQPILPHLLNYHKIRPEIAGETKNVP